MSHDTSKQGVLFEGLSKKAVIAKVRWSWFVGQSEGENQGVLALVLSPR